METELSNDIDSNKGLDFSHVTAIASRWMLDFSFTSLCRHFKEGKLDDFDHTLKTLEAISQGCKLRNEQAQKKEIAAFLGGIMHGQQLDVVCDEDNLTPLMAATNLWKTLRDTVADEDEYNSISTLLHVQSVAVCLEKGQKTMASTALQWLEEKQDIPKNLAIKLSMLVAKGDICHPFMRNFPYKHLQEKVQAYLDAFLAEKPSDFLFKAAVKVAQSYQSQDSSDEQDESFSQTTEKSSPDVTKPKKRQLLTKQAALWQPTSGKKPRNDMDNQETHSTQLTEKSLETTAIRRGKKKWTSFLDELLIKGVGKHGEGNWKLMLLDHDFQGRTGTMLKDRWRILKRDQVS
ncbi:unnamed protein product [Lota lota]